MPDGPTGEGQASRASLAAGRDAVIRRYGPWTANNIQIADDLYTIEPRPAESKTRRLVQIVSDVCGPDMSGLRVLDLACLEGLYAIELALQGAESVGIEIREPHLAKARFIKEARSLDRLELLQDDVRNLSVDVHGRFDVVICSGILYHLDAPDVFELVQSMADVCTRLLILDTHTSIAPRVERSWRGQTYWGCVYREHSDDAGAEERTQRLWQSIDNTFSFWFTEGSLFNLLEDVGFSSAYRCFNPRMNDPLDRATYVALKGAPVSLRANPTPPAAQDRRWPKRRSFRVSPFQLPMYRAWEEARDWLPAGVVQRLKRAFGIPTPPVLPDRET